MGKLKCVYKTVPNLCCSNPWRHLITNYSKTTFTKEIQIQIISYMLSDIGGQLAVCRGRSNYGIV